MTSRRRQYWGVLGVLAVAVAAALLWPAPDPLTGAKTVAIRTGEAGGGAFDIENELRIELRDRHLTIVSDERDADVVLAITDVRLDLGDVELSLVEGRFAGRLSAVCRIEDVQSGRAYVMDFHLRLRNGRVEADLVGRRFWEFWKPAPRGA